MFVFLIYLGSDFLVWLIVVVIIECFIVVCFFFKVSVLCSVNKVWSVIFFLFCMVFCFNVYFLWIIEFFEVYLNISDVVKCIVGFEFDFFLMDVWFLVDVFIYLFILIFICLVLNILII